ncbi:hypothetical protein LIER_27409 [Lithospermum erythrorhizon]|uniref:Uncharacterized protein n=1 Tax=Lithospermum erythrorhizon TaxID=34254 RepID=A0AAV3RD44_LITER
MVNSLENVAMQVKTQFPPRSNTYGNNNNNFGNRTKPRFEKVDRSNMVCDLCDKKGHVKSQCFKLVGYLEKWSKPKSGQFNGRLRVNNVCCQDYQEAGQEQDTPLGSMC